ncbi:MAG: hypothetical protein U9Q81_08280 [Pseudomonadota bacterium]|nr:hypothetical protein [Pseudomonadota bacterium]
MSSEFIDGCKTFLRGSYWWWFKWKWLRYIMLSANVVGAFSLLLLFLATDLFIKYSVVASVFLSLLFFSNAGLILLPLTLVLFFLIRWGWVVPLFCGLGLLIWQVYIYSRDGSWTSISATEGFSKFIDLGFLYGEQDWSDLKGIAVMVLDFVPYSDALFIIGAIWFFAAVSNWHYLKIQSMSKEAER